MDADVLVIGGGLAGLVATAELAAAGRSVIVDRLRTAAVAGWPGVLVDRRSLPCQHPGAADGCGYGTRPSWRRADWLGSAAFDRSEDYWPRQWAEAFVDFASGEQQSWFRGLGVRWFPLVQWAERGGYAAPGHGNSVPRFHLTWGTGPALVEPFSQAVLKSHRVRLRNRHKVTQLSVGRRRRPGPR